MKNKCEFLRNSRFKVPFAAILRSKPSVILKENKSLLLTYYIINVC